MTPPDHDEGLGYYWWSLAGEKWVSLRAAETAAACEQRTGALSSASACTGEPTTSSGGSDPRMSSGRLRYRTQSSGSTVLQREAGDSIALQAGAATTLGRLLAMQGDFGQARELYDFGAGLLPIRRNGGQRCGHNHARCVDRASTRVIRRPGRSTSAQGADELQALGNQAFFSTVAVLSRVRACTSQERFDETRELCATVREASPPDDLINFVSQTPSTDVSSLSTGRHDDAEVLLNRAVERSGEDRLLLRASRRPPPACRGAPSSPLTRRHVAGGGAALALLDAKGDVTGRGSRARTPRRARNQVA